MRLWRLLSVVLMGVSLLLPPGAQAETIDIFADVKAEFNLATQYMARFLERAIGIKFNGDIPLIDFDRLQIGSHRNIISEYRPGQPEPIVLSVAFTRCDVSPLYDPKRINPASPKQQGECAPNELKQLLAHQLGYHYLALVIRRHSRSGWLASLADPQLTIADMSQRIAVQIIAEGVAYYFETIPTTSQRTTWLDEIFERSVTEAAIITMLPQYLQESGWKISKPVLDVAAEQGLICMVQNGFNVPKIGYEWDFSTVLKYRNEMLECVKS